METSSIKEYEKLKKKYSLPDFDELDRDFDISEIEEECSLLKNIRKKITEKIDFFREFIKDILEPDTTSISNLHECKVFKDSEKDFLFGLYSKLILINRKAINLVISNDDGLESEFISDTFKEWQEIKESLNEINKKIILSWESEKKDNENVEYFG